MISAARGREGHGALSRIVFDEGHHLFDAADSTFGAALTEARGDRVAALGDRAGDQRAKGRRRGLAARLLRRGEL